MGGEPRAGAIDPATGKRIKYWAAPMDPTYIRNEPGKSPMGMDLVPVFEEEGGEKEPASTIRIDPLTVQNMGVRTASVEVRPLKRTIRAYGSVTWDETRLFVVNTKFGGWIEKLHADYVGQEVARGQPLFEIYSPELLTAQEEYLLALDQVRRLGDSSYPGVRDSAGRLLAAAETRLRYWDLTETQIERLARTGEKTKTVTVFSPATGVVISKNVLDGGQVMAGMKLFEIADLSRLWVDVEVYEYELPWVHEGMEARMELSYLPGQSFSGRVLKIYPYLTEKTRTARLRLEFENPDRQLKPGMYANVTLTSARAGSGIVVPQEAVIDSGVRQLVFLARGKGRFEPREVRLGMEVDDSHFQVLEGLEEGDLVVVSAQFMLDSESRLREAIAKMLEARQEDSSGADSMDMEGLSMDEDPMDMEGLSMDEPGEAVPAGGAPDEPGHPHQGGK
ncbi:MAG: efflux RND transporter periplasmic adaptor subunit [Proteobacteria bacterium]|nr:efflux RND transporter periplasmic adaptor subunit [Pseudomonadota bacterium]